MLIRRLLPIALCTVASAASAQLQPEQRFHVNSVHGQAVNRLAAGLRVEARAPDGLIEAFSVEGAPGFRKRVGEHELGDPRDP